MADIARGSMGLALEWKLVQCPIFPGASKNRNLSSTGEFRKDLSRCGERCHRLR